MNAFAYINGFPTNKPIIHFYAIIILLGAGLALFLSNYRAHKDGFGWNFFDSVFLLAFPSGVIGARIWYVIATYSQEFASRPWYKIFAIWEGGLAIQGGALFGILAGVIYCLCRRKGTSILRIMDYAVPTILIAQAIGRWGNFFNQEVFGHAVSLEAWNFIPSWITDNMTNGNSSMLNGYGVIIPEGGIASPLFLVEGVVNLMFYFVIAHGLPALEGKHFRDGDSSFAYFIAYGITRAILEPLRNPKFIMGDGGSATMEKSTYRSYGMAIAFICIGVALIIINHVLYHLASKGKLDKVPALKKIFIDDQNIVSLEVSSVSQNDKPKIPFVPKKNAESSMDTGMDLEKLRALEKKQKEEQRKED